MMKQMEKANMRETVRVFSTVPEHYYVELLKKIPTKYLMQELKSRTEYTEGQLLQMYEVLGNIRRD